MTIPPLPVTDGIPAECMVVRVGGEWRTAWLTGLRVSPPFGEPFSDPRKAAQASMRINREVGA